MASETVFPDFLRTTESGSTSGGLTKREYIATAALQGILANSVIYERIGTIDTVKYAVIMADQLIEELAKS